MHPGPDVCPLSGMGRSAVAERAAPVGPLMFSPLKPGLCPAGGRHPPLTCRYINTVD